jgi:hypothetical protein
MPWVHERRADQSLPIADKTYYLDGEGNVTTDSTVAVMQIAAQGSPISKRDQEKYGIPTAPAEKAEKVAQDDEAKADSPKSNKKATPSKNKGAK